MRSSPWQVHGLLSDVQRRCGAQRRECCGGNHLRKMLPAGALLPNEEQLDYSIAIEYGLPQALPVPKVDPSDADFAPFTPLQLFPLRIVQLVLVVAR
ncbi:hypothetical protein LOK49_LG13G02843 [Camellia lanceoleosa]|uniref:Uncharacterized protein n=1 Tax=Camellia lanceoleosa TaxID=1840588 RepID=A0ACC0FK69_9ERIC|nr:hypothetical protein LOK49_LG13G02843 [Camellia lanceoleosa]